MIGPTFSRLKGPVFCFNSRLLRSSVYPVLCRITEIVPALRLSPGRRWSLEFTAGELSLARVIELTFELAIPVTWGSESLGVDFLSQRAVRR